MKTKLNLAKGIWFLNGNLYMLTALFCLVLMKIKEYNPILIVTNTLILLFISIVAFSYVFGESINEHNKED